MFKTDGSDISERKALAFGSTNSFSEDRESAEEEELQLIEREAGEESKKDEEDLGALRVFQSALRRRRTTRKAIARRTTRKARARMTTAMRRRRW